MGWELGEGLGHVVPLLALARRLNAGTMHALSVGFAFENKLTAHQVAEELLAARAAEVARDMDRGNPEGGLPRAVELCLGLL